MTELNDNEKHLIKVITKLITLIIFLLFVIVLFILIHFTGIPSLSKHEHSEVKISPPSTKSTTEEPTGVETLWQAPDLSSLEKEKNKEAILYGKELIANTAIYLGPKGKVSASSNGMNCQNCHLDAGTRPFGNNYSAVASTYPKFRERSGGMENIYKRVND
ncbi:MAG TPA: hypothetical protein VNX68_19735, partial [Nitrosopumilaceae archaeon]|nr:hypothetical protein [Nitrosopumilaceae archaeon]